MPGIWSNRWIQLTIRFGVLALLLVAYRTFGTTSEVDFSFDVFLLFVVVVILAIGMTATWFWPYLRERRHIRHHEKQFKRAAAAFEQSEYDTVVDCYRQFLACPHCEYNERVQIAIGLCRQLQGNYEEAMAEFEFARQRDSNSPKPMKRLAYLFACAPVDHLRDGTRALALARDASKLGNDADAEAFAILAAAEAETGQFDKAVVTYKKAMSLMPESLRSECRDSLEQLENGEPLRCSPEFDRSRLRSAKTDS